MTCNCIESIQFEARLEVFMKAGRIAAFLSAVIFVLPTLAAAHHAFAAEFDAGQPFVMEGEVTKVKWVNPHSWLYFDVKSADGTVTNWGVEFGTPSQLAGRGLTRTDVAVGSVVRVKGFKSRNGGSFGYSVTLTLADGRSFQTGGAQDVPEVAAK